jgi:thiol-disulfide isomerase/thioredoxin
LSLSHGSRIRNSTARCLFTLDRRRPKLRQTCSDHRQRLESQRFQALALDADGSLLAAWLDKRNRVPAAARGDKYVGAGLAVAWLRDHGASFSETRIALDNTCECCRLAVGFAAAGRPVLAFRNIFDDMVRDHAVITFTDAHTPGPVRRVSVDDWKTEACPHQGPALAIAADGSYHVAWFTNGTARKGLFYARSSDGGETFSPPLRIGDPARSPSRPFLLAAGQTLWLAWKEFDGEHTSVRTMTSHDDGPHMAGADDGGAHLRRIGSSAPGQQRGAGLPVLANADRRLPPAAAGGDAMKWPSLMALIGAIVLQSAASAGATEVRAFGRGSWEQIRKAHAGEAVVVHFWGVTCGPCRAELPQWGRLLNKRADLRLVTIDADLVPNAPSAVRAMLKQSGLSAHAENRMFSDGFVERLRYEIDPQWGGDIPRTLLIAPDGTTSALEGVADFARISAWLDAQPAARK